MNEDKYLEKLESRLLAVDRNNAELTSEWTNSFPTFAGVYLAWQEDRIIYVGETGHLAKRMDDLMDTRNHILRRKIGCEMYNKKISSGELFSTSNEKALDEFFRGNISISFLVVGLGRKELEELIVDKHDPIYNQKGKRS